MATSHFAYAEKRRSMRIDEHIILTVTVMGGGRGRYVEKVTTLAVNCHGCRYRAKYKPAVGELVLLKLNTDRDRIDSAQARVRWLKETVLGTERVWEIAAELERPGNFWGVASPPEDWLSPSANNVIAQELQIVPRPQQQLVSVPSRGNIQAVLGPMPASVAPLVTSISDHVQRLVSETVMTALAKEHANFVEKFHAQLHGEMTNTLNRVTTHCKERLIRSAVGELTQALEASARKTQEHSINELESLRA